MRVCLCVCEGVFMSVWVLVSVMYGASIRATRACMQMHVCTLISCTHTYTQTQHTIHAHIHTQHTHTQALHEKACEAGISMVNEVGLDPGIDHMLAVQCFDEVQRKGGKVSRRGRWEGGGSGGRWEGGAVEGDKGILCTLHYTSCAPPLSNLPHQNTTSL